MQVSVESGEGLERRVLVDIPAEPVQAAIDDKLKELAGTVRIDGFRPGKVPARIVKQRFYKHARQDVVSDLMASSYKEALEQQGLKAAGQPTAIDEREAAEKGGFSYTATLEVMPEVTLKDITDQQLVNQESAITDADVDTTIQTMRKQKATEVDVERAAEEGDTLYLDYVGTVDGEVFAGSEGNNQAVAIGSKTMSEHFEASLVGASVGDQLSITEILAEHYVDEVKGKTAEYTVTVLRVTASPLPELDEAFIQSLDIEDGTEASLRSAVTENLEVELQRRLTELRKEKALALLKKINPLEVPTALVTLQAENLRSKLLDEWRIPRKDQDKFGIGLEHFMERAKDHVHLHFLVKKIVEEQSFQVSEDELRSMAHKIAKSYQKPEQFVETCLREQASRETLRNNVLENKVVNWIYQQVTVENQHLTFEALKNLPAAEDNDDKQDQTDA